MTDAIQDRVRGTLLGLAAGDRNGGPLRMAVRLAESLIACRQFDPADVLSRYLAWWREGAFDTGPVAAAVFSEIEAGFAPEAAPIQVHRRLAGKTAGCNPAHRSPPLAMAAFLPEERLASAALREAAMTHWDPLAGDVAAATVVLCRALILGLEWTEALHHAADTRLLQTRLALLDPNSEPLQADGFAPHVLQAAIYFVQSHTRFTDALTAALEFAGPANYAPVLVGAIGGARWGAAAIPDTALVHDPALLPKVRAAAERLAEEWSPV